MPDVIWQSKRFPDLKLTQEHFEFLKESFPEIKHFQPHFRDMEVWLDGRPDRQPKSHWRAFINNWMRKAVKILKQEEVEATARAQARTGYGDAARRTPHDPKLLGDILSNVGADHDLPSKPSKGAQQ